MKPFLAVLVLVASGAFGFDFGGSVESSAGAGSSSAGNVTSNSSLKLWALGSWGAVKFQMRGNLNSALFVGLGADHPVTNTLSGGLDTLLVDAGWLRAGRADFRDFGGMVLNTKLDGLQVALQSPGLDFRLYGGTSAALFKSASTIAISEEDTKDRKVYEDWRNPQTLWASPRIVAGLEGAATGLWRDQSFQAAVLGQADLRAGSPVSGDRANTSVADRVGAPVSTVYGGLGWTGRLVGPLYGAVWGYGSWGTSLTAVGAPVTVAGDKQKGDSKYQVWKSSVLLGGLGNAELTLLLPSLSFLLINTGVQIGSWDPDGATPDQNAGTTPNSLEPSVYTGWTGISRTGGALVFNPQPANLVQARLVASIRPTETVQIASSTFVSARATPSPISEDVLVPDSRGLYLGTESDLALLWRPASDLGVTLTGGVFWAQREVIDHPPEGKFQASVALSF